MEEFNEETQFVADEVSGIVKETIENVIGGQTYCNTKVSQWTASVVENCLLGLTGLQKPFKYIVNCTIMQKNPGQDSTLPVLAFGTTQQTAAVLCDGKTRRCTASSQYLGLPSNSNSPSPQHYRHSAKW